MPWSLKLALLTVLPLVALSSNLTPLAAQKPDKQRQSNDGAEIRKLLERWTAKKTAAGHAGDVYLNMDGGHSDMGARKQLKRISGNLGHFFGKTPLIKENKDYSPTKNALIGNASVRLGPSSVTNVAYHNRLVLHLLAAKYRQNMMWMFPSVNDYKRAAKGGDAFLTNTPYVVTSIGMSGSDQPFMKAWSYAMRAFRPSVKTKLKQSGLLMPTLQKIFRMSNAQVTSPEIYLSGKAHAPAFYGKDVRPLQMTQMAHDMTEETIPPLVNLKVVREDVSRLGVDYFEVREAERLADTPQCIARIFRTKNQTKQMVVTAEASYDFNDKPLRFTWVVLQGDEKWIKIRPVGSDRAMAEITVSHFGSFRDPQSRLLTNRVDIGVFAHNGITYSSPAFVTFYTLPSELRTYDKQGRIVEMSYSAWNTDLYARIEDWDQLFRLILEGPADERRVQLLREAYSEAELATLAAGWQEYRSKFQKLLEKEKDKIKPARPNKPSGIKGSFRQRAANRFGKLSEQASRVLTKPLPGGQTLESLLLRSLERLRNDPNFLSDNATLIEQSLSKRDSAQRQQLEKVRDEVVAGGVLVPTAGGNYRLNPIRLTSAPPAKRLTGFEKNQLERLNLTIMGNALYPEFVPPSVGRVHLDKGLATPKAWRRDVYHYDADEKPAGWSRFQSSGITRYAASGKLENGRPVNYKLVAPPESKGGPAILTPVYQKAP